MIFYFSGTGNSRYVAERLSESLGDKVVPLADALWHGMPEMVDGERVVIVTPVYFYGLPSIVSDFITTANLGTGEIHMVFTYGAMSGGVGKFTAKRLASVGREMASAHYVMMPENYTPIFRIPDDETVRELTLTAKERAPEIAKSIESGERGDFIRDGGLWPAFNSVVIQKLYKRARRTKRFVASEACNLCGKCARECPMEIIEITDDGPVWNAERCVMCLGCMHNCPQTAISRGGKTKKYGRYVNPEFE